MDQTHTAARAALENLDAARIVAEAERLLYSGRRNLARGLLRLSVLADPRSRAAWELLAESHDLENQPRIADSLRMIARNLSSPHGDIAS